MSRLNSSSGAMFALALRIVLNVVLQFGDGFFGLLYLVLNGVFKFFCSKALFLKRYVFFLFTRVIMMTFLWTRFARFLDLAPFSLIVGVWSFHV